MSKGPSVKFNTENCAGTTDGPWLMDLPSLLGKKERFLVRKNFYFLKQFTAFIASILKSVVIRLGFLLRSDIYLILTSVNLVLYLVKLVFRARTSVYRS